MDPRSLSLLALFCALFLTPAAHAGETLDERVASFKPALGEAPAEAQAKCRRLSDDAKNRNAKVLVIAYEGLISFSAAATKHAYLYQYQLSHSQKADRPRGALAGFVVSGLMIPAIEKYKGKFEFLAFPNTAQSDHEGSAAELCALEWMKVAGRKLVIVGHSFGGDAAVQLAGQLEQRSVKIDTVITLDPVPKSPRPASVIHTTRNASHWLNYYQRSFPPFGKALDESPVNVRLRVRHTKLPAHPEVLEALSSRLDKIL